MRTLILSDLHLGNQSDYDIYAGGSGLAELLRQNLDQPTRVIFNGDTVDFLMNTDPLELEEPRAVEQARAIAANPETAETFRALGEVLAAGGEAILRLGNHDVELALQGVQAVFRDALEQPAEVASRLRFEFGDAPMLLEERGVRMLITHGDHNDAWNKVDYARLPDVKGNAPAAPGAFVYPSGSLLVKQLLNPLKKEYGLRFADLLKPDFRGAVLTGVAVNPGAMKLAFSRTTLKIMRQLFRDSRTGTSFSTIDQEAEPELGLADVVDEAGLTEAERLQLSMMLDPDMVSFDLSPDQPPDSARLKLARAGLKLYARFHRSVARGVGDAFFELEPDPAEVTEAKRLAEKFQAQAVITGHTHAARWKESDGLLVANTGTWIWLMRLPDENASDADWLAYLTELQQNPGLDPAKQKLARTERVLTVATIEPARDGVDIALRKWEPGEGLVTLGRTSLKASI